MHVFRLSALTLGLSLVAGCASSADDPGATSGAVLPGAVAGTKLTIREYCALRRAAAQPWCDYQDKCCSGADRAAATTMPFCDASETVSECEASVAELVSKGGVEFHGEYASDCVTKIYSSIPSPPSACSGLKLATYVDWRHPLPSHVASCREMFRGRKALGQECAYAYDCQPDLACVEQGKVWTCAAPGKAFAHCGLDSECAPGLQCIGEVCRPLQGLGGPCTFAADCESGLICADTCQPAVADGLSCSKSIFACGYGSACDFETSLCRPLPADGTTCTSNAGCAGRCDDATKRCVSTCGGKRW